VPVGSAELPIGTLDSRPGAGHSAPVNDDDFERRLADLLATLDDASALLAKHGAQHWADWLREDRERISNHDRHGLEHLLMAFGGMASLNDLVFHPLNGNASGEGLDGWDNDELDALRSKIFRNATALRHELDRP
jgi:hypothetical protein